MNNFLNLLMGLSRVVIRLGIETVHRLLMNIFDTLFGFLNWPKKKLRIKVFILINGQGKPVISPSDLQGAIEYAKRSFLKNFNIELMAHGNGFVEILYENASAETLYTKGGIGALQEEFKIAGSFFADHLSGRVYPVTAFVVIAISNATGCSLGPISDYITLNPEGAGNASTLSHELAHACGLWHLNERSNLLWRFNNRGDKVKWWQKNVFRASRHVTYW